MSDRNGTSDKTQWESIKVEGGQILDQFQRLIHEGNVRRIVISREGKPIVEFPLTVGVVGVALLAPLAAVGAIAALIADCTIEVEREKPEAEATNGVVMTPTLVDDGVPTSV